MRTLFAIGAALALAAVASAAPNVGNTTQKGSLLIWPDIRVDDGYNTIVTISNDGTGSVDVKCYWMDGNKNRDDFVVTLTKNQTIWFDAKYGDGTKPINPMPKLANYPIWDNPFLPDTGRFGYFKGTLVCFAVTDTESRTRKWNHLTGTAVVFNASAGTAYEYAAYAFVKEPVGSSSSSSLVPPPAELIPLDGIAYDACPQYLVGTVFPAPKVLSSLDDDGRRAPWFGVIRNRIAVTSCKLILKQDWWPVWTKLQFDVWDANESKRTGGYECADSWHEVNFGELDAAAQVFDVPTSVGRYRLRSEASDRCPDATPLTTEVGLLAVHSTLIGFANQKLAEYGTTLSGAGKSPQATSFILWDPVELCEGQTGCTGVPEGRIR